MLSAALRDGTAGRRTTFEVFARRLPAAAGTGWWRDRPVPGSLGRVRLRRRRTGLRRIVPGPGDAGLPARLPVRWRRRRIPRGRLVLPRLPGADDHRQLRRMRRPGDADAVDLQPRQRDRLRRRPDGQRGRRPPADRDGFTTHPRTGGGRRARAAYIAGFAGTSNLEAQRAYGVPALGTSAHAFTMLHTGTDPADTDSWGACGVPRPGRRAGRRHDSAGRHLRRHRRGSQCDRRRRHRGWARCASTPAISACWPARCAGNSTISAPPAPASWCPATSTSTRSRRCAPTRSTATASAPRWSPDRAHRRRAWSSSSSRSTGCRWRNAAPTSSHTAAAKPPGGYPAPPAPSSKRLIYPAGQPPADDGPSRELAVPMVRGGAVLVEPDLAAARRRVADGLHSLPWEGWRSRRAIRRSRPGRCRRARRR